MTQAERSRRHYERNKQRMIRRAAEWARDNPERARAHQATARKRHREKINAKARAKSKTPEFRAQRRAYAAKWRAANPDKVAVYAWRSSTRRRNGRIFIDGATGEWAAVLRHDPCSYCGGPAGEVDHIEPIGLGGAAADVFNFTSACRSCNAQKYNKPLLAFLRDRLAA